MSIRRRREMLLDLHNKRQRISPGLVLAWRREAGDWTAWCVCSEPGALGVHQGWITREKLRPILADPPTWG